MSMRSRRLACLWVVAGVILRASIAVASGLRVEAAPSPTPHPSQATLGAWRSLSRTSLLCIEDGRVLLPGAGAARVVGIERHGPDAWTVRDHGQLKTWKVSQQGKILRIDDSGEVVEYSRLDSVPSECVLKAFPVGPASDLPKERELAIGKEIHERLLRDQTAIKAANGKATSTNAVIIENKEYLERLIREVGWIDIHRFGAEASGNAIVLAKHSRDLSLIMGILPLVEKDYKSPSADNVVFAILYDGLQIDLGRKQRYGTQLGKDAAGNPMVLPLEDPSRVEQFRKEIGLPPLAEYLKLASEGLYSGKPIRMPRDDE